MPEEAQATHFTTLIQFSCKWWPIMGTQIDTMLSLQLWHNYMHLVSLTHHRVGHPNLSMICPMVILASRSHMPLSSDVIDWHVALQYALFSLMFVLTICCPMFHWQALKHLSMRKQSKSQGCLGLLLRDKDPILEESGRQYKSTVFAKYQLSAQVST